MTYEEILAAAMGETVPAQTTASPLQIPQAPMTYEEILQAALGGPQQVPVEPPQPPGGFQRRLLSGTIGAIGNTLTSVPRAYLETLQQAGKAFVPGYVEEEDFSTQPYIDQLKDVRQSFDQAARMVSPPPETTIQRAIEAAPQVVADVVPYALNPVAGLINTFSQTYSRDLNDAADKGLDISLPVIAASAAAQTAIERMAGPEAILAKFGLGKTLYTGAKKVALDMAKSFVGEPIEEGFQAGVGGVARAIQGEFKDVSGAAAVNQVMNEAWEDMKVAAILGPAMGGAVSLGQNMRSRVKVYEPAPPRDGYTPWQPGAVRDDLDYDSARMFTDLVGVIGEEQSSLAMRAVEAHAGTLGVELDDYVNTRLVKIVKSGVAPDDALFQAAAEVAPGPLWYSKLDDALSGDRILQFGLHADADELAAGKRGKGVTWGFLRERLKTAEFGIKDEELRFSGLDALPADKIVTREELREIAAENAITLSEEWLGEVPAQKTAEIERLKKEYNDTYERYLAEGVSHEELLYGSAPWSIRLRELDIALRDVTESIVKPKYADRPELQSPGGERYFEFVLGMPSHGDTQYARGHYGGVMPNAVVHVRGKWYNGLDGKRRLHVDEIQSDLHKQAYDLRMKEIDRIREERGIEKTDVEAIREIAKEVPTDFGYGDAVPDLPFKSTWHELAVKRMLRYAAEQGADEMSWTTGETQTKRYTTALRTVVDKVDWADGKASMSKDGKNVITLQYNDRGVITGHNQNVNTIQGEDIVGSTLEQYVGKKVANQILASPLGVVSGEQIAVGGQGFVNLYDTQVKKAVEKAVGEKAETGGADSDAVSRTKKSIAHREKMLTDLLDESLRNPSYPVTDELSLKIRTLDKEIQDLQRWLGKNSDITVHTIQLSPEFRLRQLLKGNALWQLNKAAVVFGKDGRAVIHAFTGADVSSVIHELFHVFERDLDGASKATIRQWMGVKDGEEPTVAQREKFARAGEKYFYDGEAPTESLEGVFFRLKDLMGKIYTKFVDSEIDVPVTSEVKRVFDLMFATEREINRRSDVLTELRRDIDNAISQVPIDAEAQLGSTEPPFKKPQRLRTKLKYRLMSMIRHLSTTEQYEYGRLLEGMPLDRIKMFSRIGDQVKAAGDKAAARLMYKANTYASDADRVVSDYIERVRLTGEKAPTKEQVFDRMGEAYESKDYSQVGDERLETFLREQTAPLMEEFSVMVEKLAGKPEVKQAIRENIGAYLFRRYAFFKDPENYWRKIRRDTEPYQRLFDGLSKEIDRDSFEAVKAEFRDRPEFAGHRKIFDLTYGKFLKAIEPFQDQQAFRELQREVVLRSGVKHAIRERLKALGTVAREQMTPEEFEVALDKAVENQIHGEIEHMIFKHAGVPTGGLATRSILPTVKADYLKERVLNNKLVREILGQEKNLDYLVHEFVSSLASDIKASSYREGLMQMFQRQGYVRTKEQGPSAGVRVEISSKTMREFNTAEDDPADLYYASPVVPAVMRGVEASIAANSPIFSGIIGAMKASLTLNLVNFLAQGTSVIPGAFASVGLFRSFSRSGQAGAIYQLAKETTKPGSAGTKSELLQKAGFMSVSEVRSAADDLIAAGVDEAGEFAHDIDTVRRALIEIEKSTATAVSAGAGRVGQWASAAFELFRRADVAVKVFAYKSILDEIMSKTGATEVTPEIRMEAAKMALMMTQSPKTNPNIVRFLSGRGAKSIPAKALQLLTFGFQSFVYQSAKIHAMSVAYGLRDLAKATAGQGLTPEQRIKHAGYGMDRISGALMSSWLMWELIAKFAFDDEEEEKVDAVKRFGYSDQQNGRVLPGVPGWLRAGSDEGRPMVERSNGRIYFNITDAGSSDLSESTYRTFGLLAKSISKLYQEIEENGEPTGEAFRLLSEIPGELGDLLIQPSPLAQNLLPVVGWEFRRGGEGSPVVDQFFPRDRPRLAKETPLTPFSDRLTVEGVGLAGRKMLPTEVKRWADIMLGLTYELDLQPYERLGPKSKSMRNQLEYAAGRLGTTLAPMKLEASERVNSRMNLEWMKFSTRASGAKTDWKNAVTLEERAEILRRNEDDWNKTMGKLSRVYGDLQVAGLSDMEIEWLTNDREYRPNAVPKKIREYLIKGYIPKLEYYLED